MRHEDRDRFRRTLLFALFLALAVSLPPALLRSDEPQEPSEEQRRTFEDRVAPLLVARCVECHGPRAAKGRLDLSRKATALAGGDGGDAIVPGDPDASLLWTYVESDEMPKGRKPLTNDEKTLLRRWIEGGAAWTIDPLVATEPASRVWIQRLTVAEYVETVRCAFGVDVSEEAERLLPRDVRADGFSNTAYNLSVDLAHVQAYAKLAERIVEQADVLKTVAESADRDEFESVRSRWSARGNDARPLSDEERLALRGVIADFGKRLLRGPLDDRELDAFLDVADAVAQEAGDFEEALDYVAQAMLQSPRFLYRVEKVRPGDEPQPVDDYELASRLSYILWGAPPDAELMRAADAGELSDRERLEAQVARMLEDSRAIERSARFLEEWLHLDRLATLRPDPKRYPAWSSALAADMKTETLTFFRYVAWERRRPLADLLNADVTFVTPRLASHYGLASPGSSAAGADRLSVDGLLALYRFDEGDGNVVRDRSRLDSPLDLEIDDPRAVSWGPEGLSVLRSTRISGDESRRLFEALRKSKAFAVEAWILPASDSQAGPARIATFSDGTVRRNFTLGQDGNKFDLRVRSKNQGDDNGMPSLATPSGAAGSRLTHVVASRDGAGVTRLYIDGELASERKGGGDFSTWDGKFSFVLANETTGDRPWLGTYRLVALYERALSADEVARLAKAEPTKQEPVKYDLSEDTPRGGLLTQGSVLTIGGDDASMVARGLFVLHDLLDSEVGDPPPGVDTTPVPADRGRSQRAIATQRLENAACSGCHSRFEPFAFALERFDGIGAYRERDSFGNELRQDGEIQFPGSEAPVAYENAKELSDLLAGDDRVKETLTRKVTQFALGRPLAPADDEAVREIHRTAIENGGTYAATIAAVALSDLVRFAPSDER